MREDDQVKIILELKDAFLDEDDIARAILVEEETIAKMLHGQETLGLFEEGRLLSLLHITRRLKKITSKEDAALWLKQKNPAIENQIPLDLLGPEVETLLSRIERGELIFKKVS